MRAAAATCAGEEGRPWPRALVLLEARRAVGVAPNVISYGVAISACTSSDGTPKKAVVATV